MKIRQGKGAIMAKIKLDALFTELSGRCGGLVYYKVWDKVYARKYIIPHNPKSEAQESQRSLFTEAMTEWKLLSEDVKQQYRKKTRKLRMHAHNLFIQQYIKLNKNNKKPAEPQSAESAEPVSPKDNNLSLNTQPCTRSEAALYGLRISLLSDPIQAIYSLYTPPV